MKKRAWVYLLALFLLGGMCWLDTLDLTDDVPLSQSLVLEQQAIEPEEEGREHLLGLIHGAQAAWLAPPVDMQPQIRPVLSALFVSPQTDPPLYQRLSTYRI